MKVYQPSAEQGEREGALGDFPRCSALELCVSYTLMNGGQRFESQVDEGARGGWITTQVEKLRAAIVIWQFHATDMRIFSARQGEAERSGWGARYGLPKFQLALAPILLPNWPQVRRWIEQIPITLNKQPSQANQHAWRRLTLGERETQLGNTPRESSFSPEALTCRLKRLRMKTGIPRWMRCAQHDQAWRESTALKYGVRWGGSDVLDVMNRQGISSLASVHAYNAQLHTALRRCKVLKQHNAAAKTQRLHISISSHPAERARCLLCKTTGYFSLSKAWLASSSPNGLGVDRAGRAEGSIRDIEEAEQTYRSHHVIMTNILRMERI